MIEKYQDNAALAAAGLPQEESRVALVADGNRVAIDGVNVEKCIPSWADPIYVDTDGYTHIIDKETFDASLIPEGWSYKGPFVQMRDKDTAAVFMGDFASLPAEKYLDVCQYAWTDVELDGVEHTKTIGIRTALGWAADTTVNITYTATTLAEAAAAATAAIEAALAENAAEAALWWAYADEANSRVIIQRDACSDYRFYLCTGLTHITWGTMPANNTYLKANGLSTNYRGLMAIAGGAAYWATSSTRVLSANVAVGSEAGNTDPMKKVDFLESPYAAQVREYYGTYEAYLAGEFGIMWPAPAFGAFALPDAKVLTDTYGPEMAPTKTGGTKAKYPALNWAYNQGGYLWGVTEGTLLMDDTNRAAINAVQREAGKVTISAAVSRWFAQRYNAHDAWIFYGTNRYLHASSVYGRYQVGALTLLKLNKR